ncbi:MAG: YceI family protein [Bacteriovoracaceae bacterium]
MKKMMSALLVGCMFALNAFGVEIDTNKSSLTWKGTKVTGEHYGNLSFKSGEVTLKDDKLVGGEFEVEIDSLTVNDLEGEWRDKLMGHLRSEDFFEISKYPTSKLKINSVKGNTVNADLTIKGKTHPVKFDYKKEGEAYVGNFKFDRTKFGMIYNSGNFFKDLGDKLVHNDVLVNFKLAFLKK